LAKLRPMTSDYLQLQDLYTAGIGFDLAGAVLLARGLINRPAELTRLAGSFWGSNAYQAISVARNRLDAVAGVVALGAGFTLQAAGYVASLARQHREHTGTRDAAIAIGLGFFALIAALIAGTAYRRRGLLPLLIEMSRYTMDERRMDFPRAQLLPGWLVALGNARIEGENDLTYVRRVAKVEDLTVDVAQTADFPNPRTRRASEPPLEGEPAA
jgi:hypothetical protein